MIDKVVDNLVNKKQKIRIANLIYAGKSSQVDKKWFTQSINSSLTKKLKQLNINTVSVINLKCYIIAVKCKNEFAREIRN